MINRAELNIFGGATSSFLGDIESYNINDEQVRKKMEENRYQLDKMLTAEVQQSGSKIAQAIHENRQTVSIHFDPSILTEEELKKTILTDAKAEQYNRGAANWRHKSKHRSITSQVNCYGDGVGRQYHPSFKMILTTGCGPNFMGSSQLDEETFTYKNPVTATVQLKNPHYYLNTIHLLFTRWLQEQDQAGAEVVIFPLVGGGVYLKKLSIDEQIKAKHLINQALKLALETTSFHHIQEVVFALPDTKDNERTEDYQRAMHDFTGYINNKVALTIANVDVFSACQQVVNIQKKVGLINPGSDRTIGGHYKQVLRDQEKGKGPQTIGKVTLEELICNLTDTVYVQAGDFNAKLLSSQNNAKPYEGLKNSALPLFERGMYDMVHIVFHDQSAALYFSQHLKDNLGITKETKPGQAKQVDDREAGQYVIRLSKFDYERMQQHQQSKQHPWLLIDYQDIPLRDKEIIIPHVKKTVKKRGLISFFTGNQQVAVQLPTKQPLKGCKPF